MKVKCTKMHGLGNDMIMIDNLDGHISLNKKQISELCDRRFGIGADGLILVEKSDSIDCFMNYYNQDGTPVEMCGNGIRCAADFYRTVSGDTKDTLHIDTRAGIKEIKITGAHEYAVDMGAPSYTSKDFLSEEVDLEEHNFNCVSFGNPHAIAFVDSVEKIELEKIGPKVECNPFFPNKVNVSFVEIVRPDYIKVRVWERGCGVTLACGTGACAAYTIARKKGLVESSAEVELPGGILRISEAENGHIIMSGPAATVFSTEIEIGE